MRGEFPVVASLDYKTAARIFVLFGFVHGKELETRFGFDLGRGARGQLERNAIKREGQLVAGNALFFGQGIGANQSGISFDVGKRSVADKHTAKFRLAANEIPKAEFVALLALREQNRPWIDPQKVLSVPFTVVVVFTGKSDLVPGRVPLVKQEIQFKVDVG